MKKPRFGLFENVDRLLKSPASQRGRDFAIILSCLADLDYTVEWRVVNSAEYGFPQRRKRVYIFCEKNAGKVDLVDRMHNGVMAKAFPAIYPDEMSELDGFARPLRELNSFWRRPKDLSIQECWRPAGLSYSDLRLCRELSR